MKLTKTGLPQGYTKYDAFVWYNPDGTNTASIFVKQSLALQFARYAGFTYPIKNYAHIPFITDTTAERVMKRHLPAKSTTINFIQKEREENRK